MARRSTPRLAVCLALLTACTAGRMDGGDDDGKGDSTGTGGGGGGGGIAPDASCPAVSFTTTRTTPSVQLLIDRSLSMGYTLDASTGTSRYQAMTTAVVEVVGQLQSEVYFGASLYTQDSTACPRIHSTASRALMNLSQVQSLITSLGPGGNTPTAAAFTATAAMFTANPPPTGSPPIIVLATDGFPNNCTPTGDPYGDTETAIANAHAAGIRTFVLGIGGVAENYLQRIANAGLGVTATDKPAKFYSASSSQDLRAAFQSIIGTVASCEVAISGVVDPQIAELGTVTLDGMLLEHGSEWVVVNGSTLRLEGEACSKFKSSTASHVEATFPCTAVILL